MIWDRRVFETFRYGYEKLINQSGKIHLCIALDLNKIEKASKPFQSEEYETLTLYHDLRQP